ncbi:heterokaryon incompatibility protein-domain-containing protein [Hyaloscypha sp. PMI_1271]|nr:heterokaryon incompatibility protein-domain-containing protein [Hyaloscypha sp. PMI_1271]
MWLINVETMQLEDFTVRPAPEYAILSHTWSEEEVSLQEFTCQNADTAKKEGFAKIVRTCSLAAENHIKYAWVDTCCIDKSSSADLTEAINSMFQWYKNAVVCYAYLSDLSPRQDAVTGDQKVDVSRQDYSLASRNELQGCKWFTRGWTLQELIAPKIVGFYDETWAFRGTKDDLAEPIESITHIDNAILRGYKKLADRAIAMRMAWASKRKTTRVEDVAYCLLGIFDVNMPLLYGEGNKAFTRLQEEIIKSNSDLSIFGWSPEERLISFSYPALSNVGCEVGCGHRDDNGDDFYSILATSPSEFLTPHSYNIVQSVEHSVTNRGIKIYCSLLEICLRGCNFVHCKCCGDNRKYVLVIGSVRLGFVGKYWGVVLDKISPDAFIRSGKHLIYIERDAFVAGQATPRAIYLLTQAPKSARHATLSLVIREGSDFIIQSTAPAEKWNSCKRYWYMEGGFAMWCMVSLKFGNVAGHGVSILVILHHVYVLDPRVYGAEIRLISQAGSNLDWGDIGEIFDFESLHRGGLKVMDRKLEVVAEFRSSLSEGYALEVWTEDIESDGRPARA